MNRGAEIPTQELLLRIIRPSASSRKGSFWTVVFFRSSSKTIIVPIANSWSNQTQEDHCNKIHHQTKTKHFLRLKRKPLHGMRWDTRHPNKKNIKVAGQMTLLSTRYAALNYLLPDDPFAPLKEPHVYQCLGKSSDASADGPGTTGSSAVASGEEIQNSLCKTLEKRTHIFDACRPVREWSLLQ